MNYRIPKSNLPFAPPIYNCKKTSKTLVLDGNLDKDFWADADFTDEFLDIEGDCKPKPRFSTRVKMVWDDENIYFGAELIGDEIWAHVKNRDDVIFFDNDFEIFIDTDSDTQQYVEFEMNAKNTIWDLLLTKAYRDGGKAIDSFDIKGLRSAVKIYGALNDPSAENKKWTLEVVMPFKSLMETKNQSKSPVEGEYWRVNFSRVQWTVDIVNNEYIKCCDADKKPLPEDNWVWAPTGVVNIHYPEYWGFVYFTQGDMTYELSQLEYVRNSMYKIYYHQHQLFDETGAFSTDVSSLVEVANVTIKPEIEITKNTFEMRCKADNGDTIVLLSDGKSYIKTN